MEEQSNILEEARKMLSPLVYLAAKSLTDLDSGDLSKKIQETRKLMQSAACLGGYWEKIDSHDLRGRIGLLVDKLDITYNRDNLFGSLESLKNIIIATTYLETKDPRFLSNISPVNLKMGLEYELYEEELKKLLEISEGTRVNEAEYFCMIQFIKNSNRVRTYLREAKIKVKVSTSERYDIASVSDSGLGLLDKKGQPITHERIADIFGAFSTTGGGLGLQLVRELVSMRNGFIEVQTKRKDETKIITYNNLKGFIEKPTSDLGIFPLGNTGTCFSVYFPKN